MNNKISKINKSNSLQLTICAITLLINAISYFFLPDEVGVQVNSSGISNYIPKTIYIIVSFLIISLLSYFASKPIGSKKNKYTCVAILLSIMNMVTITLNLIFLT